MGKISRRDFLAAAAVLGAEAAGVAHSRLPRKFPGEGVATFSRKV